MDAPTQFFRTKTLDYLYGSLLAIGLLIFLMVPYFKAHLFNDDDADDVGGTTAEIAGAAEAEPA